MSKVLNKLKGEVTKATNALNDAKEMLELAKAELEGATAAGTGVEEAQAAVDKAQEAVDAAAEKLSAAEAALAVEAGTSPAASVVPVLTYDGEEIPTNTEIRLLTAESGMCLTDNDGNRITDSSPVKVNGGDLRDGDWYTTQFKAGLLVVDSIRTLK